MIKLLTASAWILSAALAVIIAACLRAACRERSLGNSKLVSGHLRRAWIGVAASLLPWAWLIYGEECEDCRQLRDGHAMYLRMVSLLFAVAGFAGGYIAAGHAQPLPGVLASLGYYCILAIGISALLFGVFVAAKPSAGQE